MAKTKIIKALFTEDNYKMYMDFMEKSNLPYTIIESNYTLKIESEFCNIQFLASVMERPAFIAGAMVKKDITNTGLTPPDIDKDDLIYFNFAIPEYLKKGKHTIYNVDIKSAYARILYNHSLITPKTFGYMSRLSKRNRLACVGMLAAKKEYKNIIGREVMESITEIKKTENWFYFAVDRVNRIMNICRDKSKRSFLFFWVDGIFCSSEKDAKEIGRLLLDMGYNSSFDVCTEFEFTGKNKLQYYKGQGEDRELKKLSLPVKNKNVDEFLVNFLQFYKNEKKIIYT